jgi:hypothetical protein
VEIIKKFSSIIPGIIISLFLAIIPTVTKTLVEVEKWDFPETKVKQLIWRQFVLKFFVFATVIITSFKGMLIDYEFLDRFIGTTFAETN